MYHLVADQDGDPAQELVPAIARQRFADHLSYLRRYYRFVELVEIQAAVSARRRGEPFPVAVTFDDDLGNHVTHALPELQKANASATFFLCGSFVKGPPKDFWWQRLQRAVDRDADLSHLLGTGSIHQLGEAMEVLAPEKRDTIAEDLGKLASPVEQDELLTAQDARRLPYVGFHTVRHDRLTGLDDEQLRLALEEGRIELGNVAGYPMDTIAYPHGHANQRVIEAARKEGFAIGVTCRKEPVLPSSDPLALGRYEPPARTSVSELGFDLVRILLKARC